MTTQVRGMIIKTPDSSPGCMSSRADRRPSRWKSPVAPMAVDIELDGAGFIMALTVEPKR